MFSKDVVYEAMKIGGPSFCLLQQNDHYQQLRIWLEHWSHTPPLLPECWSLSLVTSFFFHQCSIIYSSSFPVRLLLGFQFEGMMMPYLKTLCAHSRMPASVVILLHSLDPMFNKSLQPPSPACYLYNSNCRCARQCFLPEKQKSVLVTLISISNEKNSFTLLLKNLLFYTHTYT